VDDIELIDCGEGRKLERFASVRVVRPAPAATAPVRDAAAWDDPDLEFVRRDASSPTGEWITRRPPPSPWLVTSAGVRLELAPAPAGQLGIFPEQAPLRQRLAAWLTDRGEIGAPVLDLFGFTGGTTITAAAAGADVTFVDGAKPMVPRLRANLAHNGLAEAPVRSITEDVLRFVAREVRRRRAYRVIALDPPTFGRGKGGTAFHIERDLDVLLGDVRRLLLDGPSVVLLTAHTEGWTASRLVAQLERAFRGRPGRTDSGELALRAASGARLPSGLFAWRETT
jgi:23S rRNA (cytosine1962-C5)-methyltransferase